jgi:hypothetical protein
MGACTLLVVEEGEQVGVVSNVYIYFCFSVSSHKIVTHIYLQHTHTHTQTKKNTEGEKIRKIIEKIPGVPKSA